MTALISWNDKCKLDLDGTVHIETTATTARAIDPAYPGGNCLTDDPSKVTRFTYTRNATAGQFIEVGTVFTIGTETVRAISAVNCRLPAGTVSVYAAALNIFGTLVQAGATINAADLVPISGTTDRYNLHWLLPADAPCARVSFYLNTAPSTTDYFEIGRLWGGGALVLPSFDSGWGFGVVDPSEVERTRGGASIARTLPRRRTIRAPITARTYNVTHGTPGTPAAPSIRQLLLDVGRGDPLVIIPRAEDVHAAQVAGLFAALKDMREINHQGGDYFGVDITAEEIR